MEPPSLHLDVGKALGNNDKQVRPSKSKRSLFSSKSRAPSMPSSPYMHAAQSSAEDMSTTSDSRDYQTDYTTPAESDTYPEDLQPDAVEDFRDREYPQLKGKTYLDHGGTTLYAKSLIEEFSADLISNLYGNPHSASSPSALAGHRIDTIRERTLRFFNADPAHFDLIFTANATASIKLVIDCMKDHAAASNTPIWYGYHRDAHTSIVGVREATKLHRCFTSDEEVDIWINSGGLGGPRPRQLGLFAYPGQSNMTGRRLPLSWPGKIRKMFHKAPTYTILDAAALATTSPLDLSDPATAPDFTALSFYKIFGFPNIGALIVRKESAHVLQSRKFFGGGTVDMVIAINDTWHAKKSDVLHERLEDGTLPFHSIFALDHAMNVHERLYGPSPMKFISHHTAQLGKQLYDILSGLKHSNGVPLCRIYKDENAVYGDPSVQGATIAFNVQRSDKSLIGYEVVEEAADERDIFVRSGSLCNPGGVATYLDWSPAEMRAAYAAGHRCSNPTQIMLGKPTGVVRVSLGAMSTSGDIQVLRRFLEQTYLNQSLQNLRKSVSMNFEYNPSSGRATSGSLGSLVIPNGPLHQLLTPITPSDNENNVWDFPIMSASNANSPSLMPIDMEKPKAPPFIPADYTKWRRPWEEELRTGKYATANMESPRDEDSTPSIRHGASSVKARKFGRSMLNVLRTKTHATPDAAFSPSRLPETPVSPIQLPPLRHVEESNASFRSGSSRRSVDKATFSSNIQALGL